MSAKTVYAIQRCINRVWLTLLELDTPEQAAALVPQFDPQLGKLRVKPVTLKGGEQA